MSDAIVTFRCKLGAGNGYFPEALGNDVVLKHVAPDFRSRYAASDVDGLKADMSAIFRAVHGGELRARNWLTRFMASALKFYDTPSARFLTYYNGEVWWCETDAPAYLYRTVDESDDPSDPVHAHLMARPLTRSWSRLSRSGLPLREVIHPYAWSTLTTIYPEMDHPRPEMAAYFDDVINDRDLSGWHGRDAWRRAARAAERRTTPSPGKTKTGTKPDKGRGPEAAITAFAEEKAVSYTVVKDGSLDGYIYAFAVDGLPGWFKVGFTTHESVEARRRELQAGNPLPLTIAYTTPARLAELAERKAHIYLDDAPRGAGKEWFRTDLATIQHAVDFGAQYVQRALERLRVSEAA